MIEVYSLSKTAPLENVQFQYLKVTLSSRMMGLGGRMHLLLVVGDTQMPCSAIGGDR